MASAESGLKPSCLIKPGDAAGFTLIELVVVLMVLSILLVAAINRLPESEGFERASTAEKIKSLAAQARTTAAQTECSVYLDVSSRKVSLSFASCDRNQGIVRDAQGEPLSVSVLKGDFTASAPRFTFHPSGELSPEGIVFYHLQKTVPIDMRLLN